MDGEQGVQPDYVARGEQLRQLVAHMSSDEIVERLDPDR